VKCAQLQLGQTETLVVLGAGASRGASFVDPRHTLYKPPLDADYFKLLAVSPAGRSPQARALLKYVRENYSPTLDVSMEFVFVELQGTAEFYRDFKIDRGRLSGRPQRTIEHFYKVLPQMLSYSINSECEHHRKLANALQPRDAVISLNYDCLMDSALRDCGGRKWDPAIGYGLRISLGAQAWRDWGPGRTASTPIRLLKLHGSLNWRAKDGRSLLAASSPYARSTAKGVVVPPLGRKPVSEVPFRHVWAEARVRLRSARRLIVIGYSLPAADYLVRALFRADLKPEQLTELLVVDPSPEVAERFVRLLRSPLRKIMTFGSFEEFAEYLPNH
jgi:hypothetical protein